MKGNDSGASVSISIPVVPPPGRVSADITPGNLRHLKSRPNFSK